MKKFSLNDPDIFRRTIGINYLAFAFLNNMPIVPGHTLICPIRIVAESKFLTNEEWLKILDLKEAVCSQLKAHLGAQGFNFAWNENIIAGQTVPHFHLHIVPRKNNDMGITQYDPRVFLYRPGTRATTQDEELYSLATLLCLKE